MTKLDKALYTATATATGGRGGRTKTDDGSLDFSLTVPQGLGGPGGAGTNPEQLFALGYAACFAGALGVVARREKVKVDGAEITAKVTIGQAGQGYALAVALEGKLPGLERAQAEALMKAAHEVCPYSVATRGNVEVAISVV